MGRVQLYHQWINCINADDLPGACALVDQADEDCKSPEARRIFFAPLKLQHDTIVLFHQCLRHGDRESAEEYLLGNGISMHVRPRLEKLLSQAGDTTPTKKKKSKQQMPVQEEGGQSGMSESFLELLGDIEHQVERGESDGVDGAVPRNGEAVPEDHRPFILSKSPDEGALRARDQELWSRALPSLQEFAGRYRDKGFHVGRTSKKEVLGAILDGGAAGIPVKVLASNFWNDDGSSKNIVDAMAQLVSALNRDLAAAPGCPKVVLDPAGNYRIVFLSETLDHGVPVSPDAELGYAIQRKLTRSQLLAFRALWRNRNCITHTGELCYELWGDAEFTIKRRDAIKQMVAKLRSQLRKIPEAARLSIATRRGVGYALDMSPEPAAHPLPEASTTAEGDGTLDA